MEYLLMPKNLKVLESFTLVNTLYAFDFDGTLAPIVDNASTARMTSTTNQLIKQLSMYAPVAIISGRRLSELEKILQFKPRYLIGNHGLEGILIDEELEKLKQITLKLKERLTVSLKDLMVDPAIIIEDKTYTLSVHYRNAIDQDEAKLKIESALSFLSKEARIVLGKFVFNIIPWNAPHKGYALDCILKSAKCNFSFYIGDDDTDEDVFSSGHSRLLSVRVGENLNSKAKYYLKKQDEINTMLTQLIIFYGSRP